MTAPFSFTIAFLSTVLQLLKPGGVQGPVAENLALRRHILVLDRGRQRAPDLRPAGRIWLALASLFVAPTRFLKTAVAVRLPRSFGCIAHWSVGSTGALVAPKLRSKPVPKGPSTELRNATISLKKRDPRFGGPGTAMIVSRTFGVEVDKDVVRRVLTCDHRSDPRHNGPSWLSFLGPAFDSLWGVDLLRCESIVLKS